VFVRFAIRKDVRIFRTNSTSRLILYGLSFFPFLACGILKVQEKTKCEKKIELARSDYVLSVLDEKREQL